MSDSAIDNNRVHTALAVNETTGLAEALQCATASGRLLIDITAVSNSTPGAIPTIRDNNYIPGLMCVENDDGTISPLIADSRNGYLFVDVEIE